MRVCHPFITKYYLSIYYGNKNIMHKKAPLVNQWSLASEKSE
jgi:hypothetical protein